MADPYFVLKDFGSYSMAQRRVNADYANKDKWLKMAVINTAMAGFFSSDRTIRGRPPEARLKESEKLIKRFPEIRLKEWRPCTYPKPHL